MRVGDACRTVIRLPEPRHRRESGTRRVCLGHRIGVGSRELFVGGDKVQVVVARARGGDGVLVVALAVRRVRFAVRDGDVRLFVEIQRERFVYIIGDEERIRLDGHVRHRIVARIITDGGDVFDGDPRVRRRERSDISPFAFAPGFPLVARHKQCGDKRDAEYKQNAQYLLFHAFLPDLFDLPRREKENQRQQDLPPARPCGASAHTAAAAAPYFCTVRNISVFLYAFPFA